MKTVVAVLITLFSSILLAAEIEPSLAVSGSCFRTVKPDLIEMTVGVRLRDADAQKATTRAAGIYENLLKQIKQLKLAGVEYETVSSTVHKVSEWVKDRQVDKGFESFYAFNVRTSDIARVGDLLKAANNNGANEVLGPQPMLSKKLRQKEYEACLAEAVLNARSKAETMAQTLKRRLSEKVVISEAAEEQPYVESRIMAKGARAEMAMDSAPTIEVRREDIRVQVNATFYLK